MLLEGKAIGFRYDRGSWVLRGVSLRVGPGEVVGLKGPSGKGKTTLARVLAGYLAPAEGDVLLDGERRRRNGFNPVQLIYQHPEKAVNPRWRMRKVLAEAGADDPAMLHRLGIDETWLDRWPNELSGGELQRVCLARALGPQTRYLIADEITTMLDAVTQAQIWQAILDKVRDDGLGVLAVSHDDSLLRRLAARILDIEELIQE